MGSGILSPNVNKATELRSSQRLIRRQRHAMDRKLDFIVEGYCQLRLHGSPLRSVSFNSPTRSRISPTKKAQLVRPETTEDIYRLCSNAVELVLNRLTAVKSLESLHIRLASACFTQLYTLDLENVEIAKKHHTFILRLIELEGRLQGDYKVVITEVRSAMFRSSNHHGSILNAPSSPTNNVLKLFMLQIIFKLFQKTDYTYAEELLSFLLREENNADFTTHQKLSTVKLILSIGRIAPSSQFKACMSLKFLHLLIQLNMKFETFITNMNQETFVRDLNSLLISLKTLDDVPSFLHQYAVLGRSDALANAITHVRQSSPELDWKLVVPNAGASNSAMRLLHMSSVNTDLIQTELAHIKRPTWELVSAVGLYIIKSLPTISEGLTGIMLFYVDHCSATEKTTHTVLDKTLISAKLLNDGGDFLEIYFKRLWKIYSRAGDFKRLRNLSNVSFNVKLYQLSLLVEREVYLQGSQPSDLHTKYKRALHLTKNDNSQSSKVTAVIFDDSFLSKLSPRLLERLDAFDEKFGSQAVFSQLSRLPVSDLSEQNRAMIYTLVAKYATGVDLIKYYERLDISDPILQMLCGIYCTDIATAKINRVSTITTTNADPLIKSCYYFSMEIRSKSILNIPKILSVYLNSWVPRNKYPLTAFEVQFLKSIVSYLKFVNFQKSLRKLLTFIEKYKCQNFDGFSDWLSLEQLANTLNMKEIMKLSIEHFDPDFVETDFLDHTDYVLRLLPYKLLKLKFFLINFDHNKLTEVATDIYDSIALCPDIFNIENNSGFSRGKFLQVLTLLVKLMHARSKFLWVRGEHMECITSAVASIQLSKSILKSDPGNFEIIDSMASGFRNVINTLVHLGLSRDAEYYIGEFEKYNLSISKYRLLHTQNSYFICNFYHVAGRKDDCQRLKLAADEIFSSLCLINHRGTEDKYVDNYKLIYYRLLSDIFLDDIELSTSARTSLKSFLTFVETEGKILANVWRLNYEYHFNSEVVDLTMNKSQNPYLNAMNYMLNSRRLFINAQSSLNMDPLYSTLEDSAMAIPSVVKRFDNAPVPMTAQKAKSTSMKNVKKSIIGMKQSKGMIVQLLSELRYLANYQRNEIHRVFSLDLLTLSTISNSSDGKESLEDCVLLNNHIKTQPLVNEKSMIDITSRTGKKLPEFDLNNLLASTSVEFEKPDMALIKERNWQVISIDVSSINDELIITRLDDTAKMLKLPLTRLFVRTGEEITFKLKDCLTELDRIINESDKTMLSNVTNAIETADQRREWHETRSRLDEQLLALLTNIEHYWIGGFKGIFSPVKLSPEDVSSFKAKFLSIIRMNIPTRSGKNHIGRAVEIDDFVVELFLRLGDPSLLRTAEPLEDLIYFVLDILLFHGEENAYDEVDIDNIYVQIETLLSDHFAANPEPQSFSHTVLVLGKELHSVPWESIPCLRSQSISRIPSVSVLIGMIKRHNCLSVRRTGGSFIVNPAGDLKKTADRFSKCLQSLSSDLQWDGISGVKPSEEEFKEALQSSIFLYVGHGAGTSYVRETTIKNLPSIAPSLLLGCSSAALKDNHLLEPSGTVFSYLIGGCPMVVGNLWDVTDKDIDKFTLAMFEGWGLTGGKAPGTICDAVRVSRDECKLKYLNGAAPVVYGLPLTLQ